MRILTAVGAYTPVGACAGAVGSDTVTPGSCGSMPASGVGVPAGFVRSGPETTGSGAVIAGSGAATAAGAGVELFVRQPLSAGDPSPWPLLIGAERVI